MDNVFIGTTIKIAVTFDGTSSFALADCEGVFVKVWTASSNDACSDFESASNVVTVPKSQAIIIDNTMTVEIPTDLIGEGYVIVRAELQVPDEDCTSGYRKEILQGVPNIKII